ncbi:MAG: hypothetical protein ACRDT2_02700 [Natronosporangium sp.]
MATRGARHHQRRIAVGEPDQKPQRRLPSGEGLRDQVPNLVAELLAHPTSQPAKLPRSLS